MHASYRFTALIHGGAPFIDRFAGQWAAMHPEIQRYVCRADWRRYGHSAGPRRNSRMLDWGPTLVVAFPGQNGTADMVAKSHAAGIQVIDTMHYGNPPHVPSLEDLTILKCRCGWHSDELTRDQLAALGVPWYCEACSRQSLHWATFHPRERAAALDALGIREGKPRRQGGSAL